MDTAGEEELIRLDYVEALNSEWRYGIWLSVAVGESEKVLVCTGY